MPSKEKIGERVLIMTSKELTMKLADQLRQEGKNFVIAIEVDDEINTQTNVSGDSKLRDLAKMVEEMK